MARKKKRRVRNASDASATTASESNGRDFDAMLREEYAYVIKDLRIIFLVAVLMFAILIVLNLVL